MSYCEWDALLRDCIAKGDLMATVATIKRMQEFGYTPSKSSITPPPEATPSESSP